MNNLNSVLLEGELVKSPDFQPDSQGNPVCRFTLASNRFFKGGNGIEKETSCFDIEANGNLALLCKQNGHGGRGVRVVGRLKQEHFRDADGQPAARIVIAAEHVEFRPSMAPGQKRPAHNAEDYDMER